MYLIYSWLFIFDSDDFRGFLGLFIVIYSFALLSPKQACRSMSVNLIPYLIVGIVYLYLIWLRY